MLLYRQYDIMLLLNWSGDVKANSRLTDKSAVYTWEVDLTALNLDIE